MTIRAEIITLEIRNLGAEYNLDVRKIEPEVITLVLKETGKNTFGSRPDKFLIDQMLGMSFADASSREDEDEAETVEVILIDDIVCIKAVLSE